MILSNKMLGAFGMIAAPFLFLQMYFSDGPDTNNTSLGGFFDLIYMLGWMCSILGLIRLQATGTKKAGVVLLYVQLVLLCIANVWNVWVIFDPTNSSALFFILDLFWPLSNVCMLVTGIAIAVAGKLRSWKRYVVLIAGLWLPIMFSIIAFVGKGNIAFYVSCFYTTLAWGLLGWAVYTSGAENKQEKMQLAL